MAVTDRQTVLILDWLPEPNANVRADDWRKRQARLKKAQVMVALHAKRAGLIPVRGKARLTIVLTFPQQRRRDTDNLYARTKGLVDGLVKGGWLRDDSSDTLELIVRGEVRPGSTATQLVLEAV